MKHQRIILYIILNLLITNSIFSQNNCLDEIDNIVVKGIQAKAMPGCRILVIKDSKEVYNKSFGHFTYDSIKTVDEHTIYDIASITKVAATTLAIMKLYEDNKIDLEKTLGDYLEIAKGSNKENIKIKEILTHSSGLKSWTPFYLDEDNKINNAIFSNDSSEQFNIHVANNFWADKNVKEYMLNKIMQSALLERNKYLYSDIGMYLLKEIIENISEMSLDKYLKKTFFEPLSLNEIDFKPYTNLNIENIPPTENDRTFRKQIIQGYVHDQGAAMLGGVSGHAGLFSDANSLGIILQMLINEGEYEGLRLLKKETIQKFTSYQLPEQRNRRGLGFDKPLYNYSSNGNTSKYASAQSYGHSGFTGTFVWADPKYKLIYVFLSNRTFPDAENKKLIQMNIRTEIQDIIYKCLTQ